MVNWSWFPQITADEDSVYIVWTENSLTNSEIYFTGLYVSSTGINENIADLHTGLNNYPNPFSSQTVINYQLRFSGMLVLKVYDMLGHEVRTLVNENQSKGKHSVVWDGKNNSGNAVKPGVYFYLIRTENNFSEIKKTILL